MDKNFQKMLKGYSLTTAEILYGLPDHPKLLQTFLWQDYDVFPQFPKLVGFCEFWQKQLDGKIRKVQVAHSSLIRPAELKMISGEFRLN